MNRLKRKASQIIIFTGVYLKIIMRDKMNLFWYMAFPMILALLFGYLVPNVGGTQKMVMVTPDFENGVYQDITGIFSNVEAQLGESQDKVMQQFEKGYIEQLIILNANYDITLFVAERTAALNKILKIIAADRKVGFSTIEKQIRSVKAIDYVIPGTIALTLCQIGLFGGMDLLGDRKQKILRRLKINNVSPSSLILSHIFSRLGLMFIAAMEIILIGKFLFGTPIVIHSIIALIIAIFIGGLTFLSIGLLISSVISSTTTATIISQCLNFPMAFLGGVYMPISVLPAPIQPIAELLPVSSLTKVMRGLLMDGIERGDFIICMLYLLPVLFGCLLLGIKLFRWE